MGEAGKVYYASQWVKDAQNLFASGELPPYYASMHGVLLHVTVGFIGNLLDLPSQSFYMIGRGTSLVCTLGVFLIVWKMFKHSKIHWQWYLFFILAFLTPEPINNHMVSYRPDHWNLLLSFFACYVLICLPIQKFSLSILACLPVIAFHIKAPGIAMCLPIVICLSFRVGYKKALITLGGTIGTWLMVIAMLHFYSGGKYTQGLIGGLEMPYGWTYLQTAIGINYLYLIGLVMLVMAVKQMSNKTSRVADPVVPLLIFGITHTIIAAISSLRAGGSTYYALAAYCYGLIILIHWLSQLKKSPAIKANLSACALVVFFVATLCHPVIRQWFNPSQDRQIDASIRQSIWVGKSRVPMAREINQLGLKCFSDDCGLNVLLDSPMLIDPMLRALAVENGSLSIEQLVLPVKNQEYDIIALTGMVWFYRDTPSMPKPLVDAIQKYYRLMDSPYQYHLFVPKESASTAQPQK